MSARPELEALAERLGIVPAFHDLAGHERRAPESTREALIAAMGHDASSEAAARESLGELELEARERWLDPVRVWREHAADLPRVELRPGRAADLARLALELEDGRLLEVERSFSAGRAGRVSLALPGRPPTGYHRLRVELEDGRELEQLFVAAPRTAPLVRELLGERRAFGLAVNLYSVRGRSSLGHGDLGDLEQLLLELARAGGDFVGLNPLHALHNRGQAISPYSPLSRRWRNALYIDLERVPEWRACAAARARVEGSAGARAVKALRRSESIEHEAVLSLKLGALRELHGQFVREHGSQETARALEYADFLREGGSSLEDFATFEVLVEERTRESAADADWRRWPAALRDPRSAAVIACRREHAAAVDFRAWLQFELERQLGQVARAGRDAGLGLGIVNDLAVGSPPDSADAWSRPDLVAGGVSLGAPPDAFASEGQNWGLVPLAPNRLRADAFGSWTRLVRASLAHAGGLRIDHAIGLERTFWIPDGRPGSEGAYVRQPAQDLLGILALEARRAGALVIGEDLGVVPEGLKQRLASWGLLSTSVMLFEREGHAFRAPRAYSPRTLVTATTHDLVPLAGYEAGSDLELRAAVEGEDDGQLEAARAGRRADLVELGRALDAAGVEAGSLAQRAHRFLARTPAPLLALGLDDLAGEREPINLPGISTARHRSWSRRMGRPLGEIDLEPEVVAERLR